MLQHAWIITIAMLLQPSATTAPRTKSVMGPPLFFGADEIYVLTGRQRFPRVQRVVMTEATRVDRDFQHGERSDLIGAPLIVANLTTGDPLPVAERVRAFSTAIRGHVVAAGEKTLTLRLLNPEPGEPAELTLPLHKSARLYFPCPLPIYSPTHSTTDLSRLPAGRRVGLAVREGVVVAIFLTTVVSAEPMW
jgi:hypothetical protein